MNFIAKICFFFRRTFSIIRTITAKRATVLCSSKFTDCKRKTINHKIFAERYGKNRNHFLTQQFCCLEQRTSCSVKTSSTEKVGKEMVVILFHERKPGIFRINSSQLTANAYGNNFRIRQFGIQNMSSGNHFRRGKLMI